MIHVHSRANTRIARQNVTQKEFYEQILTSGGLTFSGHDDNYRESTSEECRTRMDESTDLTRRQCLPELPNR